MGNFEPVGDRARWRYVYDLLQLTDENEILTYEQMGKVLQLDPAADRMLIQGALYRAAKELETVNKRAVTVVPGRGYRVVPPKEQLDLANQHQKRSSKALVRGHSKVVNVNLADADPETKRRFAVVAGIFARQMDFNRQIDQKMAEHQELLGAMQSEQKRSAAENEEILARLQRLEDRLHGQP